MLKTSISFSEATNLETVRLRMQQMHEAGLQATDFDIYSDPMRKLLHADNCDEVLAEIKKISEETGVELYQAHAPYHAYYYQQEERNRQTLIDTRLSIHAAGKLGVKEFVVHPVFTSMDDPMFKDRDEIMRRNIEFYGELVPMAAEYGMHICTENMFTSDEKGDVAPCFASRAQDLVDLMNEVPGLTMNFDVGHAKLLNYDSAEMIRQYGSKLTALHLHGNNGRRDLHISPCEMASNDWEGIAQALKDVNYSGTINLEADNFFINMPQRLMVPAFKFLNESCLYIGELIEKAK